MAFHAHAPEQLGMPLLSHLLSSSVDGIIIVDQERRYLYANAAAGEIMGVPPDQLVGRDFLENIPPVMHESILQAFSETWRGQTGRRFSIIVRPDGTERDIEYATMPLLHDGRQLATSIFHDVTEGRRNERVASALTHIASNLILDQTLEEKLNALAAHTVMASRALACAVVLVDDELRLQTVGAAGFTSDVLDAFFSTWPDSNPMDSHAVRAFVTRQTSVAEDMRGQDFNRPRYDHVRELMLSLPWDVQATCPIVYRAKGYGSLCAYFPVGTRVSTNDIELLEAIANQAAIAIENHRLYEAAQGMAVLEERQRLARELHDSVSQALYGIGLGAKTARTHLDSNPEAVFEPLEYVLSLAETGLDELRALIFELQPEALMADGLVASLEAQLARLYSRHGITTSFNHCAEPDVPLLVKEAAYRIAQEAIHNTVKHAAATSLTLDLTHSTEGLTIELRDDGIGFDPHGSFPGHLGLRSMRERASVLGGQVDIESAPGNGTRIRATFPPGRQQR